MRIALCAVLCGLAVVPVGNSRAWLDGAVRARAGSGLLEPGWTGLYALALVPGSVGGLLSRRADWLSSYTTNVLVGIAAMIFAVLPVAAAAPGDNAMAMAILMPVLMVSSMGVMGGVLVAPVVWLVWGRTGPSTER